MGKHRVQPTAEKGNVEGVSHQAGTLCKPSTHHVHRSCTSLHSVPMSLHHMAQKQYFMQSYSVCATAKSLEEHPCMGRRIHSVRTPHRPWVLVHCLTHGTGEMVETLGVAPETSS